tara:strand:- start:23 stop:484 length:462 start_codon:yes stop_codon:yes gene_type:complete
MIKKFLKVSLFFFIIILSNSCGYEPLNKSLNSKKINITDKIFEGDKKINKKIFSKLNFKRKENSPSYSLKLKSNSKIYDLSKDQSGNITSYKTTITTYVALIKDQEIVKDKSFEESFTYSNQDNKFKLSTYQREVEDNLIDKIVQNIRLFLNF